ncbi:response regulator [Marivibrio halodurans]|uniref:Response regulator n=1 Tax=Marivibrio halodurans TaxID=2039722 RepID=A0A8J7RXE6_9PROT|nr:response regulator [Marivibrio halodurans]MBP5856180.1 response regulator [Marivibrio halodurans]
MQGKELRVLVVDDEPDVLSLVARTLEGVGYDVTTAKDGYVAVRELRDRQFDVVVTDIVMPKMDGLELIVQLRKTKAGVPIVALSGGGVAKNMDVLRYAETFGASAILEKPFSPAQLIETLDRVLSRRDE